MPNMTNLLSVLPEEVDLKDLSNRTTRTVLIYLDEELTTRDLRMTRDEVVAAIKSIVSKDSESAWKVHLQIFSHLMSKHINDASTSAVTAQPPLHRLLRRDLTIPDLFYLELVKSCNMNMFFIETLMMATNSSEPVLKEYCGRMFPEVVTRTYQSLADVSGIRGEAQLLSQRQALMHLLLITRMCITLRCRSAFEAFKKILEDLKNQETLSILWKLQTIIRLIGSQLIRIEDFVGNSAITELLDNLDFCPIAELAQKPSENWKFLRCLFHSIPTAEDHSHEKANEAMIKGVIEPLVDCLYQIKFSVMGEEENGDGVKVVIEPGSSLKLAVKTKDMHDFQYVGDCAYLVTLLLKRFSSGWFIEELRYEYLFQKLQAVLQYLEKFKSRPDFQGAFGNAKVDFEGFSNYLKTKVILRHELPLWHEKFFGFNEAFKTDLWYTVGEEIVAPRINSEVGLQQIQKILDLYKVNIPERAKRLIISIATSKQLLKIFQKVVQIILENRPVDLLVTETFQSEVNGFCTKLITADSSYLSDQIISEEHIKIIYGLMLQNPLLAGAALLHRSLRLPRMLQLALLNMLDPFWCLPHDVNGSLISACVKKLISKCCKETGNLKPFEDFLLNLLSNVKMSYLKYHELLVDALVVRFLRRSDDEVSRLLLMYRNCGVVVHSIELSERKREQFKMHYHEKLEGFIQFSFLNDWKDNAGPLARGELFEAHEEFPGGHAAISKLLHRNNELITSLTLTDLILLHARIPQMRKVVEDCVHKKNLDDLDLNIKMLELIIRNSSQQEWFKILDLLFIICTRKYSPKERLIKWLSFVSGILLLDGTIQIPREVIGNAGETEKEPRPFNQTAFVLYQEFGKVLVRYLLQHERPASLEFQFNHEAKFHLTHVLAAAVVVFPEEPKYLAGKRALIPSLFQLIKHVHGESLTNALEKKYLLLIVTLKQNYSGRRSEFLPMIDTMLGYVVAKLSSVK